MSHTVCGGFRVMQTLRCLSTCATLTGLTFSAIRHRHDVADWLATSYDRSEILKEFARLQMPTSPAQPTSTPKNNPQGSTDNHRSASESNQSSVAPSPQSIANSSPTPMGAATSEAPKVQSTSTAHVSASVQHNTGSDSSQPANSPSERSPAPAVTSEPSPQIPMQVSEAAAPAPSEDAALRSSYVKAQQRYTDMDEKLQAFRAGDRAKRPAEVIVAEALWGNLQVGEVVKQNLQVLEEEDRAHRYSERFTSALDAFETAASRIERLLACAEADAEAGRKYMQMYGRAELLHLGQKALVGSVRDEEGLRTGIQCLKAAREQQPLDLVAKVQLVRLYDELGRLDEAYAEVWQVTHGDQKIPPRGQMTEEERRAAFEANMLLGRLTLGDEDPQLGVHMVVAFFQAGEYAVSTAEIQEVGLGLIQAKQPEHALRMWAATLEASPDTQSGLWQEFFKAGNTDENREIMASLAKKIAASNPSSVVAQNAVASLEFPELAKRAGELEKELASFDNSTSVPLPAEFVIAKKGLAEGQLEIKTISAGEKIGTLGSSVSEQSIGRLDAILDGVQKRIDQARDHAKQISALRSPEESQLRKKAYELLRSGRKAISREAIVYLKAARALHDDPVYANNLGVAYMKLEDYEPAKIEFLRAIVAAPMQEPGFYRNFLACCERSVEKAINVPIDEAKNAYLREASGGSRFMACYAAGTYYPSNSPRAKEWFRMAAQEISQGRTTDVPATFIEDCQRRLSAYTAAAE